jgi:hypothetical protein
MTQSMSPRERPAAALRLKKSRKSQLSDCNLAQALGRIILETCVFNRLLIDLFVTEKCVFNKKNY